MKFVEHAEYQRLLIEQAVARQQAEGAIDYIKATEGAFLDDSLNEAAGQANRKKILADAKKELDQIMSKAHIRKIPYTGDMNSKAFLDGRTNTCYLYAIDGHDWEITFAAALFINIFLVGLAHNYGLFANKDSYHIKEVVQLRNKIKGESSQYNLQTNSQIGQHAIGFRFKTEGSQIALARFGRWVTTNESSLNVIDEYRINKNIVAVQEANADQINKTFANFSVSIKKMAAQFTEFTNKQILKYKPYITNMKDQILAKVQGENMPIEMRNYPTGVTNIKNFRLPPFESIKGQIKTPGDKNACEAEMKQLLMPSYKDANVDFSQFCKTYFMGGEQKIKTNINALNMHDLHDYCANYANIQRAITDDTTALEKLQASANQTANQEKQVENQEKAAQAAAGNNNGQQPKQEATSIRAMAANNMAIINSIINEDGPTPPQQNPAQNAQGGKPADDGKMTIDKSQNQPKPQQVQTPANANQANPKDEVNNDVNILNAYKSVGLKIIGAEMHAAGTIYKDYITIMKAHAPEGGAKPQSNEVTFDNPQDMINRVAQIQKETDKNKQNRDIANLIAEVKKKNPQFNGGLNDIASAANAAIKKQQAAQNKTQNNNTNSNG